MEETYCQQCLQSNFSRCEDCDEVNEDMARQGKRAVCSDCAERYRYCDGCNQSQTEACYNNEEEGEEVIKAEV